jgi:hypothetical protein
LLDWASSLPNSHSAALAAPSCANALLRAARRRPHASATEFCVAHDRQFDRHHCHYGAPYAWANLAPASRAPVPRHRP